MLYEVITILSEARGHRLRHKIGVIRNVIGSSGMMPFQKRGSEVTG